jgi:hypothetical protein
MAGFNDYADDGEEEDENQSGSPGVSYLYVRDPGHESNGEGFNEDSRDQLRGKGDFSNTPGVAGFIKDRLPQYDTQHEYFSEVIGGLHEAMFEQDYERLLDSMFLDGEVLAEYLQDNPELMAEVRAELGSDESDEDDEESEEADEAEPQPTEA